MMVTCYIYLLSDYADLPVKNTATAAQPADCLWGIRTLNTPVIAAWKTCSMGLKYNIVRVRLGLILSCLFSDFVPAGHCTTSLTVRQKKQFIKQVHYWQSVIMVSGWVAPYWD